MPDYNAPEHNAWWEKREAAYRARPDVQDEIRAWQAEGQQSPEPSAQFDPAEWEAFFHHFYGADMPLNAVYEATRRLSAATQTYPGFAVAGEDPSASAYATAALSEEFINAGYLAPPPLGPGEADFAAAERTRQEDAKTAASGVPARPAEPAQLPPSLRRFLSRIMEAAEANRPPSRRPHRPAPGRSGGYGKDAARRTM